MKRRILHHGAVAQLGERRVRNAKVGSSILLGSTNSPLLDWIFPTLEYGTTRDRSHRVGAVLRLWRAIYLDHDRIETFDA